MELGEIEVELSELGFYPLKKGSKTYNIEDETDLKLIRRAVYPKDVIVKDKYKELRLSDYPESILRENKCIILQLESRGIYYDANLPYYKEANAINEMRSYGFICQDKYLEQYAKQGEIIFLKEYNQRRYDFAKSSLIIRYSMMDKFKGNSSEYQSLIYSTNKCQNAIDMFEDWFLSYEIQSAGTEDFTYYREIKEWEGKYIFNEGIDYWEIIYDGKKFAPIKGSIIMKHIKYLFEHPMNSIHINDLCDEIEKFDYSRIDSKEKIKKEKYKTEEQWKEEGFRIIERDENILILDEDGEKDLKSYLKRLSIERKKAEEEGDEITISEIDIIEQKIKKYASGKKDKKGRIIKIDPRTKRDLDKISKAYSRLLEKLSKNEEYKEFYIHLKDHLKFGIYCSYTPDRDIHWNI